MENDPRTGNRWEIEAGFKELKRDIGSAETQTRNQVAVKKNLDLCLMVSVLSAHYSHPPALSWGVISYAPPLVSRNCIFWGKHGYIVLKKRVDAGFNCVFSSVSGITIGASTIIAGNCYIGGGRYHPEQLEVPTMDQWNYSRGDIVIGENCWIGAGAIILDGVKLGKGGHCRGRSGGDERCS